MSTPDPSTSTEVGTDQRDYDERYYSQGLGLPYDGSEPHWANFFGGVADNIIRQLEPETVLDAGCAKGFLVAALAERGVDATGVDISEYAVEQAVSGAKGRVRSGSLVEPLEGRWDLVTCIEVLEHMSPAETQRAIDNLCSVTDRILLSSTPYDFDEPSHINVRPVATWAQWFATRGFFRRTDLDASYITSWTVVFERRPLTPADVVYLYEVEQVPLREEAAKKRSALLEMERQMSEILATRADGPSRQELEAGAERAEARAAAAEQRVDELLASRAWRIGQSLVQPVHRAVRSIRKRS